MSDVLERLRERNRTEMELPGGLKVTLRRPSMRDCILAGNIPLPVLAKLDELTTSPTEASPEELRAMASINDELVRRAVVAIEGEDVDLHELADLSEILSDEQRDAIQSFVSRQDAEGKG